jgi:hypothetical protein
MLQHIVTPVTVGAWLPIVLIQPTLLTRTTIELFQFKSKPSYLAGALQRCRLSTQHRTSWLWGSFEDKMHSAIPPSTSASNNDASSSHHNCYVCFLLKLLHQFIISQRHNDCTCWSDVLLLVLFVPRSSRTVLQLSGHQQIPFITVTLQQPMSNLWQKCGIP